MIGALVLSACAPQGKDSIPTFTASASHASSTVASAPASTATSIPEASPATDQPALVAFVRAGDIEVWEQATGESQSIFRAGDVIAVTMSDDGQVVAFLRRSIIGDLNSEWHEQSALWAVDRNGENPRELVSAEELRGRLNASETDSTNISQMAWIPGTHRLVFSGWTYIVQGEGESHASPEGLYLVDADTVTHMVLLPAGNHVRFVPSPDGGQIALMSLTGLSFVNVDGSDLRPDLLTYPPAGLTGPLFPIGVWSQDSRAFVMTGSLEWEPEPKFGLRFVIWRVPADGSSPESLAAISRSDPNSVTFSPDGRRVAFIQYEDQQIAGWFTTPLTADIGPLAIGPDLEVGHASLHWSPAGDAFTGTLMKLCPGANRDSELCDSPISFWGSSAAIRWIDGTRFLLLTRYPSVLFLGSTDGTTQPIVAWPLEEWVGPGSFTAAKPGY